MPNNELKPGWSSGTAVLSLDSSSSRICENLRNLLWLNIIFKLGQALFGDRISCLLGPVAAAVQNFDATCAGCVERLLKTQPGVLNASVDCRTRALHIDYDSRIVSDERIAHVAHRFAPQLLVQSQHCSWRVNQSSCETCILHVDRHPVLAPAARSIGIEPTREVGRTPRRA